MESVLSFLASIGLGSPLGRSVAMGATGFATQYFIKPSISYTTVGNKTVPKQFALTSSGNATTYFPWFFWPILFALVGGIFL